MLRSDRKLNTNCFNSRCSYSTRANLPFNWVVLSCSTGIDDTLV